MAPEQAQGLETHRRARRRLRARARSSTSASRARCPSTGNNGPSILLAIMTKDPVPPSMQGSGREVPGRRPALDDVIEEALAKNPNIRTKTVGALADAVGRAYGLDGDHLQWATTPQQELGRQIAREPRRASWRRRRRLSTWPSDPFAAPRSRRRCRWGDGPGRERSALSPTLDEPPGRAGLPVGEARVAAPGHRGAPRARRRRRGDARRDDALTPRGRRRRRARSPPVASLQREPLGRGERALGRSGRRRGTRRGRRRRRERRGRRHRAQGRRLGRERARSEGRRGEVARARRVPLPARDDGVAQPRAVPRWPPRSTAPLRPPRRLGAGASPVAARAPAPTPPRARRARPRAAPRPRATWPAPTAPRATARSTCRRSGAPRDRRRGRRACRAPCRPSSTRCAPSRARSLPVGRSSSPAVSTAPMVPTGSPVTSSFAAATYVPGRDSGTVAAYRPAPTASSGTSRAKPSGPATCAVSRRNVCALPSSPTTSARTWSSPLLVSASSRTRGSSAFRAMSRASWPKSRAASGQPSHSCPQRSL